MTMYTNATVMATMNDSPTMTNDSYTTNDSTMMTNSSYIDK